VIRVVCYYHRNILVHFLYLRVPEPILRAKVKPPDTYYFPATLIPSQINDLKGPSCQEEDTTVFNRSKSKEEVKEMVWSVIKKHVV
jgi:gluconate kinase